MSQTPRCPESVCAGLSVGTHLEVDAGVPVGRVHRRALELGQARHLTHTTAIKFARKPIDIHAILPTTIISAYTLICKLIAPAMRGWLTWLGLGTDSPPTAAMRNCDVYRTASPPFTDTSTCHLPATTATHARPRLVSACGTASEVSVLLETGRPRQAVAAPLDVVLPSRLHNAVMQPQHAVFFQPMRPHHVLRVGQQLCDQQNMHESTIHHRRLKRGPNTRPYQEAGQDTPALLSTAYPVGWRTRAARLSVRRRRCISALARRRHSRGSGWPTTHRPPPRPPQRRAQGQPHQPDGRMAHRRGVAVLKLCGVIWT
jgi:hypothetical protein